MVWVPTGHRLHVDVSLSEYEPATQQVFGPAVTDNELVFVAALLERWQPPSRPENRELGKKGAPF
jgi:hypothetical protein